jgi:AbrB family looped-hinge helix DNA binding protein
MLIEVRGRSQITLPAEIVKKLGISEGDKFEVTERDGGVFLCPVVVYPKAKIEEIAKVIKDNKENPSAVYESVEDMFKALDIDLEGGDI